MYIHNSLDFKTRPNLSIDSLSLKIISEKTFNTIVSVLYRPPPNGNFKLFENFLTNFFLNIKNLKKNVYVARDVNLELLDYSLKKKVQNVFIKLLKLLKLSLSKHLYSNNKQTY